MKEYRLVYSKKFGSLDLREKTNVKFIKLNWNFKKHNYLNNLTFISHLSFMDGFTYLPKPKIAKIRFLSELNFCLSLNQVQRLPVAAKRVILCVIFVLARENKQEKQSQAIDILWEDFISGPIHLSFVLSPCSVFISQENQ